MLFVRVRVDGGKQAPDALCAQVECALAIWRGGSIGRNGDIRQVVSRPALRLLVPPHDWFRTRIRFAVPVARRSVVEDSHVVWPGPPEPWIQAQTSGIGFRIATLREVLALREDARVDPSAGR